MYYFIGRIYCFSHETEYSDTFYVSVYCVLYIAFSVQKSHISTRGGCNKTNKTSGTLFETKQLPEIN